MFSPYEKELRIIDSKINLARRNEIPDLFEKIPLDIFGELTLQKQKEFKNIATYLPTMPSQEVQMNWTGNSGRKLLKQSTAFVKSVLAFYGNKKNLKDAYFLDFGCGWGRLSRLFLKYITEDKIFCADPWDQSLKQCYDHNVRGIFGQTDWICRSLPFGQIKFELVIAFSVFTHLSLRASEAALKTIRANIKDDALFVITVRPVEYWKSYCKDNDRNISLSDLYKQHKEVGFVFVPNNPEQTEGDITFGNTSISMDYIEKSWKAWKLAGVESNCEDPHQKIVFLKPR